MEHTTYASRLRYLDADDVDDGVVDFDGLDVRGADGAKLGDVDGFVVDATSGRVLYTVVDSGGWFTSRRILVPIGHATVDREAGELRVDVTRETLRNYPEFREDQFREFSDEELRDFERRTAAACCPDEPAGDVSVGTWSYETSRHYRQPEWWTSTAYTHERLRPVETRSYDADLTTANAPPTPTREAYDREFVRARETDRTADASPHFDGRAQPGDVLGIETGGERTGVGDTAEDENKRRRTAERAVAEDDEPRQSER